MKLVCLDPRTDPLWQQLVEQYDSSVFHSPAWIRVVAETYHFCVEAHVLLDDTGRPAAGVPFSHINDIRGKRIVTFPFSDYYDPLVTTVEQWQALMEPLFATQVPYTIRCLHNSIPLQDERLSLKTRAKWHGLALQATEEVLWQSLDSAARRAIRKAESCGVVVRPAQDKQDLRTFFELHLALRKHKYQLLAQPYAFFEHIWHHFIERQRGILLMAFSDEKVIGSTLFLEWQNKLFYKFNVSAPTKLAVRPNDLMMWVGIQYAKAIGCHYLDLGLSDWDQAGLIQYKRKFASDEKTISFLHYYPPSWQNGHSHEVIKLLPQLTSLLTDKSVPDHVTERAGEVLYRLFT